MSTPDDHASPEPFDPCFQSRPAEAPPDLVDRVMRASRTPPGMDAAAEDVEAWMEGALAAWPASPADDFTAQTLARVRAPRPASKLVFFRLAPSLAAGLAACVALVWSLPPGAPSGPRGATMTHRSVAPADVPIDPAAAEILLLAEDLERPTRWLLDESHLKTLFAVAE